MEDSNEEKKKEIEVVSGDGSELDFSEVYDHLNVIKPKAKDDEQKQNIIIPGVKEENDDNDDKNNNGTE